ncbi:DUF4007 family protein [Kouleothrix sp.]|uniref:DUF4007 family protein n=1 Tax=Kouleothrix sp. TaxID=2779161 RepID=UPI0039195C72
MSFPLTTLFPSGTVPTFSGHETFALRSNWLKKAYDILRFTPDLFYQEDAFVQLGVGKNMAQSIRFWGRACGIFERAASGEGHTITPLGHMLLGENGWDPFLVTPASHWLLHWQIASRPEAAFTWFYTFNLLKGGEFTAAELAYQLRSFAAVHDLRIPSEATIGRDVECMLNCYCRAEVRQLTSAIEDLLACPLADLGVIQALPGQHIYQLVSGTQPELPDALIAYVIREMLCIIKRQNISFSDLAYAPRSPGRVFRLDADSLLSRLQRIGETTEGRAYYTDQAGIRQVVWPDVENYSEADALLAKAFMSEVRYV